MPEFSSYQPGIPSWIDLTTRNPEGARTFYGALFGWEFDIGPAEFGYYTTCMLRGKSVAGIGGEPAPEGSPTGWVTYLASADAAKTARGIDRHGGKVMMGPMDVPGQGAMLLAFDPGGALFGVWQAGDHTGAALANEPGTITWNELITPDLKAAQEFYSALFDHSWAPVDMGGGPEYMTFAPPGRDAARDSVGGVIEVSGVPAHWMPYFGVADTDAAVAAVTGMGGTVDAPAADTPFGRRAVVRDPEGAILTLLQVPAQQ